MPNWMARKLQNPILDLLLRLAIAIPLATVGMVILVQGSHSGGYSAVFIIPVAALFFVLAAIPVAPYIAGRLAAPAANLFYPNHEFDRPQPKYSLAEGKRIRGEVREAMDQYEQILVENPGDVRCFIGMLDIAATDLRDPELTKQIADRARKDVPENVRQRLEDAYAELTSDFP